MVLGEGEPEAGPWRVAPLAELLRLLTASPTPHARPRIVAVDGRGAGGKTTLAERLRGAVLGAEVVHTDDIAWWHSRFGWSDLMLDGVLGPLHRGESVHYQPPAWALRGRTGYVDVAGDAPMVIIEGVGASRRELTTYLDAAVWVQSDFGDAERRGLRRDGGAADAAVVLNWHEWMAEELPFLAADRPWERADVIVGTSAQLDHDRENEVLLADPLSGKQAS